MKPHQAKIQHLKLISFSFLLLMTASCTSTMYVAPRQADCTGASDQKCYLIRHTPEGNWIMHYDKISGFYYEPGFSYTLKVKKERVKNPPMDASSIRYSLVELVEKKDVTDDMELEDLVDKEWKLEYLYRDGSQTQTDEHVPTLKFSQDGKINGNGGCNNFFGGYTLTGRTIKIGEIGATKMMCADAAELESTYFSLLSLELRGLFSDGKLILSADHGNRLVFSYK